jgi:putative ABC transport system ATP-binding protein
MVEAAGQPPATPLLRVAGLQVPGLDPAYFDLDKGECIAIRGPSGAGKSLLLRGIADLDPDRGGIFLEGAEKDSMDAPLWRRQVGYVPAEPGWWADLAGGHFADWSAAVPLLEELGLGAEVKCWPVAQMSTGERSRLALVRALVVKPKVLLLDEPTGALDAALAARVERLIARERDDGLAVLWVTHDAAQAARIAKRWLVIGGGKVAEAAAA